MIDIWAKIARKYEKEPTVARYDIPNESWIYNSIMPKLDSSHINEFHVKVIESIRTVDPNHMIFLEPANMHTSTFLLKENIVWSPHYYLLPSAPKYYPQNITVLEADLAAKYKTFVLEMGSPMWVGEFGAFMKDPSSTLWLQDAVKLFAKYQVGSAYWALHARAQFSLPSSPQAEGPRTILPTSFLTRTLLRYWLDLTFCICRKTHLEKGWAPQAQVIHGRQPRKELSRSTSADLL